MAGSKSRDGKSVCYIHEKYGKKAVTVLMRAAVSCGPKGQLALLVDEASQQRFLVDTGSSYSILPHKSQQPQSGPRLCIADRAPIS